MRLCSACSWRPRALRYQDKPCVLPIDEIDKVDQAFEAMLLAGGGWFGASSSDSSRFSQVGQPNSDALEPLRA
jgi:hypothetical protein